MIWRIFEYGLEDLYIKADSFDEALAKAREINPRYCGGQRVEETEISL